MRITVETDDKIILEVKGENKIVVSCSYFKEDSCRDCFFLEFDDMYCDFVPCFPFEREDEEFVIFVLKEDKGD